MQRSLACAASGPVSAQTACSRAASRKAGCVGSGGGRAVTMVMANSQCTTALPSPVRLGRLLAGETDQGDQRRGGRQYGGGGGDRMRLGLVDRLLRQVPRFR